MARGRCIEVELLPTQEENQFIVIELAYNEGGWNYFTGGHDKRGYYIHVRPEKREGNMSSFMAFSGTKLCIEEAGRFNQKRLELLSRQVTKHDSYLTRV